MPIFNPLLAPNCVALLDNIDDRPDSIVQYIDNFFDHVDYWRFTAMRASGDAQTTRNLCHRRARDTVQKVWKKF